MGSATTLSLPVIDFNNKELKPGSEEWESVKSQVRKAVEEYGCFQVLFNKVPAELRKGIIGALEELFELPMETKLKNVSDKPFHGYVGLYPQDHLYSFLKDQAPLYESMGFEEANISGNVDNVISVLWPRGNPTLSKTVQSFSEQVSELDQIIRRMILESLGLEKYMDEHMNSSTYLLRVMKYKAPETTEKKGGLHPHTDKNFVTILYQNQVDGLEVQTKDGEWISVKQSPDSFVVNIGDSLLAWSNGLLNSALHRVMVSGNEARYSTALFTVPKSGYIIKAPEELIDEEHPMLFKPYDYADFLDYYNTEAGQKDKSALKTFCGV